MRIAHTLLAIFLIRWVRCGGNNGAKEALKGAEKRNPSESTDPENSLVSKVDGSLFDLEEGEEGGFKVLKLKAKEGTSTNKVLYDGRVVWKGKDPKDACSIAIFYLGEKEPLGALYRFKRDGRLMEGYRSFSGGNWTSVNKDELTKLVKEAHSTPVTQSDGRVENDPSLESDTGTIDLNNPDSSQCQEFDYYYDDNLTRLIVPLSGRSIKKLKDDANHIWSLGNGETLQHAKAYLDKDKKPEVVFVVVKKSSGISRKYYLKNDIGWVETLLSFPDRINLIKTETKNKTDVTIDIGSEKDTEQCYLIPTELLGLQVKMFVPKLDYLVKEVKNGSESLWKAAEGKDERCLSSEIYTKGNSNPLLLITLKDKEFKSEYFEREGGEWKGINKTEFDKKKNAMQTA
ncbi:signal peptide containing protein [Theileria equi strain WA]|uniref:Signal peptide containing protein n=1 Tax=Theileria equi strain WA TaxID=1537102 RepID=L1LEK3_THEEQ|nr:signal peptide containing protein [Theileria equi strain WA]EKX73608.1 signal peptide containing protein [Theileria equi strain WA]|eukprot:XP_004833060.1 signal peptide containing protein [Theileria equi strain WA]